MNTARKALPELRHAGVVIEYFQDENDFERREESGNLGPIHDETWGKLPPLPGTIDIGLLCRREPGPICFRCTGNLAALFLSIEKTLLDLVIQYDPAKRESSPITLEGLFTLEIEDDRLMISPLSGHPRAGSKFASSFAQFSEELFSTADAIVDDLEYFFRQVTEDTALYDFGNKMKGFRTEIWNLSIRQAGQKKETPM